MDKKIIQKAGNYFTDAEKHQIIQELFSTRCTKVEIWKKYTGKEEEHGQCAAESPRAWAFAQRFRRAGYYKTYKPKEWLFEGEKGVK